MSHSRYRYQKLNCRCRRCRAANASYWRRWYWTAKVLSAQKVRATPFPSRAALAHSGGSATADDKRLGCRNAVAPAHGQALVAAL